MLKQRILTVLWLLPLMLGMLFWANHTVWGLFCGTITLLGLWEYGRMSDMNPQTQKHYLIGTGFFLLMSLAGDWQLPQFVWLMVLGFWLMIMPLWLKYKWKPVGIWAMVSGWLMMLPFWFAMMMLRADNEHIAPLLSVMVLVWIADSGAYFVGRAIGKRPLAPVISPKKSWEGAIGGWILVLIYMSWVNSQQYLGEQRSWFSMMVIATILTMVSVGGDLLESWLKRACGIKDSSQLLSGHGGVFDRIDSLIAVLGVYAAVQALTA